jgi:ankyrin repeat protein
VQNLTHEEVDKFTETIRVLIDAGADPNLLGYKGFIRTRYDEGEIKGGAVSVGVGSLGQIVPAENATESALYMVSSSGRVEAVKILLKANANVDTVCGGDDFTPLQVASYEGHEEIVKLLIAAGSNVNRAHKKGYTALHLAAMNGHIEAVKQLCSNRADLNVKAASDKGTSYTPLGIAKRFRKEVVVKFLEAYGARE